MNGTGKLDRIKISRPLVLGDSYATLRNCVVEQEAGFVGEAAIIIESNRRIRGLTVENVYIECLPELDTHGVVAANNEAQQLLYRQRDGRWVYRLSDSKTGWTRRDGGKLAVWADRDGREVVHWDGQRQTRTRLHAGWQFVLFLPGRIQGDGVEVELPPGSFLQITERQTR